jgi:hypothetical protein
MNLGISNISLKLTENYNAKCHGAPSSQNHGSTPVGTPVKYSKEDDKCTHLVH